MVKKPEEKNDGSPLADHATAADRPADEGDAFGQGEVTRIGLDLKALFEAKRWSEFADSAGLATVWWFNQPRTVTSLLTIAEETLSEVAELEVGLDRILKSERTEDKASGSYTCCLMWVEPESWKQRELTFDLHLGFAYENNEWRLAYLGVTPETLEEIPFPDEADESTLVPLSQPAGGARIGQGAQPAQVDEDRVLAYVPVWLPSAQVRSLLEGGEAIPTADMASERVKPDTQAAEREP